MEFSDYLSSKRVAR